MLNAMNSPKTTEPANRRFFFKLSGDSFSLYVFGKGSHSTKKELSQLAPTLCCFEVAFVLLGEGKHWAFRAYSLYSIFRGRSVMA
jgi:hypothetical protein